jgi:hypothetical protein
MVLMCFEGGVIPELDSHKVTEKNPDPLNERFSPWHACGTDYQSYGAGMKRASHLRLVGVTCRLTPGDADVAGAVEQWESIFGVPRGKGKGELRFTNTDVRFIEGEGGRAEGIAEIRIAVEGEQRRRGILERADKEGLRCEEKAVEMLGVRWVFVTGGNETMGRSRL